MKPYSRRYHWRPYFSETVYAFIIRHPAQHFDTPRDEEYP